MGQAVTILPYSIENEVVSISFFSSTLGVNRMRLLVIDVALTSSAFSEPFEENESFTRPKVPS